MAASGINLLAQQNLQAALLANSQALAALSINPRPDGSVDGQSNSWTGLRKSLLEEQKSILEMIQNLDAPFEVTEYGG